MKKLFTRIVFAAAAVLGFSGCSLFYEESVDTIVEWGFAEKENTDVIYGVEDILAADLFKAFDETFSKAGDALIYEHEVCLRAQKSQKSAVKNIKNLAEEAAAKLPNDYSCLVDRIFVVNYKYGSENAYKTAWSHDYRK